MRRIARVVLAGLVCAIAALSLTVTAAWGGPGDMRFKACTSPAGASGCTSNAQLVNAYGTVLSPDGKFLYVTAWGSSGVYGFNVNPATGTIAKMAGASGCVRQTPVAGDCVDGRAINGAYGIGMSPDGKHLYVAGYFSDAVAVITRNTSTGALSQAGGQDGCISQAGAESCRSGRALTRPTGIAVSPNGATVYAVHEVPGAITTMDRNASTGGLTQKTNEAGCVNNNGAETCQIGRGFSGFAAQLAVSPDGRQVYSPSRNPGGILIFNRDTATGEITQRSGTQGCITTDGAGGTCAVGSADLAGTVAVRLDPSGKNLYSLGNNGIVVYSRNPVTGNLTQTSCITENGSGGLCTDGTALTALWTGNFTPDGTALAVIDNNTSLASGITFLRRNTTTGALSQPPVLARCFTRGGQAGGVAGACTTRAFMEGYGIPVWDKAGRFVYGGQWADGAVVTFERDFAPVCVSRTIAVAHNTAINIPLTCTDANSDAVTLQITKQPTAGTLGAINTSTRTVFYNPFTGFAGQDSIQFRGIGGGSISNTATVALNVAQDPAKLDLDGDGSPASKDCNDHNHRIHPGAREKRGNKVDENCDGRKPGFGLFRQLIKSDWLAFTSFTNVLELRMRGAPKGSKGQIRCLGSGCNFKKKNVKRKRGTINFFSALKGSERRFSPGQTVEVRVTKKEFIGKVARYAIKPHATPTSRFMCLPPGKSKPKRRCGRFG